MDLLIFPLVFSLFLACGAQCPSLSNFPYAVLGPFPGNGDHFGEADALAPFGGIDNVAIDTTQYTSELVDGGKIGWSVVFSDEKGGVDITYDKINYDNLMSSLGLGALNFYSWALGNITVKDSGWYLMQCGGVSSYTVDDQKFVGDTYSLSSWWGRGGWVRLPVYLKAGYHKLKLKFRWNFQCRIMCVTGGVPGMYALVADSPSVFDPMYVHRVPDVVDKELASPYVSFPVVNARQMAVTDMSIAVAGAMNDTTAGGISTLGKLSASIIGKARPAPGQIYFLPIKLNIPTLTSCWPGSRFQVQFNITAKYSDKKTTSFLHSLPIECKAFSPDSPYAFTFLDFDGSVQFGVAKPPSAPCKGPGSQNKGEKSCGVILALHGADVDADSYVWTNAIPPLLNAWVIFPSNRDKFGYDWQGMGGWDGVHCLNAFVNSLPGVPKKQASAYKADASRLIFTGHSMGGHGCLVFSTHYADWALASVCAAGWIRFDHYVQEFTGSQSSFIDPMLDGLLKASVADYHTDVLAVNMKGVPFMARMGSDDQNVCPWNLRRFARVLDEVNGVPGWSQVSEVLGKGHWFGDVLSAPVVQRFMGWALWKGKPDLPKSFRIRSANLWNTGRGGIRILQFVSPGSSAWIDVNIDSKGNWEMQTHNVARFGLFDVDGLVIPKRKYLRIDGKKAGIYIMNSGHYCLKSPSKGWRVCKSNTWQYTEKSPMGSGPLRQVFHGEISIVYGTKSDEVAEHLSKLAVDLANRLAVRGHGLANIYTDSFARKQALPDSNIILMGGPHLNSLSETLLKNTTMSKTCAFWNNVGSFKVCGRKYTSPGTGVILLGGKLHRSSTSAPSQYMENSETMGPLPTGTGTGLIALVTGTDGDGVKNAATLIPSYPNAEVPDWVVVGDTVKWQGAGGILAAGFWGNKWECREDVTYPKFVSTVNQECDIWAGWICDTQSGIEEAVF